MTPTYPRINQNHVLCTFCHKDITINFDSGGSGKWIENYHQEMFLVCNHCLELLAILGEEVWFIKDGLTGGTAAISMYVGVDPKADAAFAVFSRSLVKTIPRKVVRGK